MNDEIGDVVRSFNVMTRSLVRKVDQLASLNQAGHAFSRHLSLDELAEALRENVREHVRPSGVGLYTLEEDPATSKEQQAAAENLRRARSEHEDTDGVIDQQSALARRAVEGEQVMLICQGNQRFSKLWLFEERRVVAFEKIVDQMYARIARFQHHFSKLSGGLRARNLNLGLMISR